MMKVQNISQVDDWNLQKRTYNITSSTKHGKNKKTVLPHCHFRLVSRRLTLLESDYNLL